jgi:alkylation response protein AidB-like acyl-CoA dehydrogenase
VRGRGGPGDEDALFDERLEFERRLGADGWTCVGWPEQFGGRGLDVAAQVVYFEEYARAGGPGRLGHMGEGLVGPTLISYGTPQQQARYLEPIRLGRELWCQGYSEPDAGSDLANLSTRAERDGDDFVINGRKVWTSLAQRSQWCFLLARTDRSLERHRGISALLVPMDAPGIDVRPIVQITGTAEFNEIFFTDVRTPAVNLVGELNGGWGVAMGLLAFERGASTLGQQLAFARQFEQAVASARASGRIADPLFVDRLAAMWTRIEIMRWNALRFLGDADKPALSGAAYLNKLYWARLHRDLGELFLDAVGIAGLVTGPGYGLSAAQQLFLFTRADTIYAGSNEIQRTVIGERALSLPREPRA